MDWTNFVVLGFFIIACLLAIHQAREENWGINLQIGTVVFLVGAAIGLFLDDLLVTNSPMLPWVEPIGAAIMLVGLLVSWFWKPA